ncbi:MAG: hypothetical protein ABR502_06965 [Chitinophagaceae bacterium]
MYSYGLLETGCYYLIQEKKDSSVNLIRATMESDHCMYVFNYGDRLVTEWKRKNDPIHDIVECLTDKAVNEWEKHYNNNEDALYEEDDE